MTHPQPQPATVDPDFARTFGDTIEWVAGIDEGADDGDEEGDG